MSNWNLPPGVTNADIDRAAGVPDDIKCGHYRCKKRIELDEDRYPMEGEMVEVGRGRRAFYCNACAAQMEDPR